MQWVHIHQEHFILIRDNLKLRIKKFHRKNTVTTNFIYLNRRETRKTYDSIDKQKGGSREENEWRYIHEENSQMSIERKVTPWFPFSFKISILNIILTNRPHFHHEIQYCPWKACVLQKMRICKQCIIKKLTQCCINTLTVCLVRGFRTRICGRTRMGTWGTSFNNSFILLDDWRNCKLTGVNKHEICRSQILALNPIKIGVIW